MQEDFHYYAAYCAAYMAGYSHEESLEIAYSDQFTDNCTATLLKKLHAPVSAATTQTSVELADAHTDILGLQNITRIWASFHFLPYDLHAKVKYSRAYRNRYRLICNSNGDLVVETVKLAKDKGLQAAGLAMHVLSDTWAHKYFAGTPSLVINNVDFQFTEFIEENGTEIERPVRFRHSLSAPDDLEKGIYANSMFDGIEANIMNLGHGRAGHFPDYSFAKYKYLPAWGKYEAVIKDNPHDYIYAFAQMLYALKYLHGDVEDFEKDKYAFDEIAPYRDEIEAFLKKRQLSAGEDWKALGEKLSGQTIPEYDVEKYQDEYASADEAAKDDTFLGGYILAALSQKSMVTARIYESKNLLAGFSVDYSKHGFHGNRDFKKLVMRLWRKA